MRVATSNIADHGIADRGAIANGVANHGAIVNGVADRPICNEGVKNVFYLKFFLKT
jgi:hypothetical protein